MCECVMPKTKLDGLPVIEADESEGITVAVKADGLREADIKNAIAPPYGSSAASMMRGC
jgi:hypothetical protein